MTNLHILIKLSEALNQPRSAQMENVLHVSLIGISVS